MAGIIRFDVEGVPEGDPIEEVPVFAHRDDSGHPQRILDAPGQALLEIRVRDHHGDLNELQQQMNKLNRCFEAIQQHINLLNRENEKRREMSLVIRDNETMRRREMNLLRRENEERGREINLLSEENEERKRETDEVRQQLNTISQRNEELLSEVASLDARMKRQDVNHERDRQEMDRLRLRLREVEARNAKNLKQLQVVKQQAFQDSGRNWRFHGEEKTGGVEDWFVGILAQSLVKVSCFLMRSILATLFYLSMPPPFGEGLKLLVKYFVIPKYLK